MALVGTQTFVEDGARNYILLSNMEQYLRRFQFYPTWQYMRVGVLFSIQNAATYFSGGLLLGVTTSANGAGVGYKQGNGANIVRGGFAVSSIWGTAWGYGAVAPLTYGMDWGAGAGSWYQNNAQYCAAYSGGSRVSSAGNVTPVYYPTTESTARKGIMMCTLQKTGASTTVLFACGGASSYTSSANTNHNYTDNSLISACSLITPNVDGGSIYVNSPATLSTNDDSLYPLDTINLLWTGSAPVRIYQIAISTGR